MLKYLRNITDPGIRYQGSGTELMLKNNYVPVNSHPINSTISPGSA